MVSQEIKTSIQGTSYYNPEDDQYYMKQTKIVNRFNQFTRKYERESKTELPPILTQDFNHLTKKLKGTVIFSRQATDYETLKPLHALFCKTFEIEVNEKAKHSWLSISPSKRRDIIYHNLREGTTQTISLNECITKSKSGDVPLFEVKFGKERRLRDENEIHELRKKSDCLPTIYQEESDGSLSSMVYFNKM